MKQVLTQEDFEKIHQLELQKRLAPAVGVKRNHEENDDILDPSSILPERKKNKQNKEERLQSVHAGREDRDKYGQRKGKMSEHSSSTNKDKARKKNPMMLKFARKFREKATMSMRDRQVRKEVWEGRRGREVIFFPLFSFFLGINARSVCLQMKKQKSMAKDRRNR